MTRGDKNRKLRLFASDIAEGRSSFVQERGPANVLLEGGVLLDVKSMSAVVTAVPLTPVNLLQTMKRHRVEVLGMFAVRDTDKFMSGRMLVAVDAFIFHPQFCSVGFANLIKRIGLAEYFRRQGYIANRHMELSTSELVAPGADAGEIFGLTVKNDRLRFF